MAYDSRPGAGSLYRLDADHAVHEMLPEVTISNGLAWTPDGTTMYYIDTPTGRVDAFDADPATGGSRIGGRLSTIPGRRPPDGMTIDDEGCLWVALLAGLGRPSLHPRWPAGHCRGAAVQQVTSCAFGGVGLDELYITTSGDRPVGCGRCRPAARRPPLPDPAGRDRSRGRRLRRLSGRHAHHRRPDHRRRHAVARPRLRRAETDDGLVGVGEVRPVNKTDSFVAVVGELGRPLRHRLGPVRRRAARLAVRARRVRPRRRASASRRWPRSTSPRWDLIGQCARRAGLQAARRAVPRSRPGVRQRLVPGRTRPGRGSPSSPRRRRRARLPGDEARSVRRRVRAAARPPSGGCAVAIVAAVREAVGPDVELMIEMHGRFAPDTAAQVAPRSSRSRPRWIEEPVPPENAAALARVRRATNTSDRDRRADPRDLGRPRRSSKAARRHRPGRPDPLRRLPRDAPAGRLGRGPLPDARAAQRRRPGRDRRQRPFRGGDAGTSHPRALQRLRRPLGQRARRRGAARSTAQMAASPCRSGPGSVSAWTMTRARASGTRRPLQLFVEGWQKRDGA